MSKPAPLELWVILPAYNGGRHLSQQLDSILGQTRLPDGVSLSDDASTDETPEIIKTFAANATFPVQVLLQKSNVGLPRNAEDAISSVPKSADVIVFSDQDDVWHIDKLERIEAAFTDPRTLLWYSDAELIDDVGTPLGQRLWELVALQGTDDLNNPKALGRMLAGVTIFGTSTAARSSLVRDSLPVPRAADGNRLKGFQVDSWVGLMAHLRAGIALDPTPSTLYRRHPSQFTAAGDPTDPALQSRDGVLERLGYEADRLSTVEHGLGSKMLTSLGGAIPPELRLRRRYLTDRLEVLRGRRAAPHLLRLLLRGDYHKYAGGLRTFLIDCARSVRRSKA